MIVESLSKEMCPCCTWLGWPDWLANWKDLRCWEVVSAVCSTLDIFGTIFIWCQVIVIRDPPVLQIFEQLSHAQSLAPSPCMPPVSGSKSLESAKWHGQNMALQRLGWSTRSWDGQVTLAGACQTSHFRTGILWMLFMKFHPQGSRRFASIRIGSKIKQWTAKGFGSLPVPCRFVSRPVYGVGLVPFGSVRFSIWLRCCYYEETFAEAVNLKLSVGLVTLWKQHLGVKNCLGLRGWVFICRFGATETYWAAL